MDLVKKGPSQRTIRHRRKYHHLMPGLLYQWGLVNETDRNNENSPYACQTAGFSAHLPCKWHFLKGFPFGQWFLESSSLARPLWWSQLNMQGQMMPCPSAGMQWERDISAWAVLLKPNILSYVSAGSVTVLPTQTQPHCPNCEHFSLIH